MVHVEGSERCFLRFTLSAFLAWSLQVTSCLHNMKLFYSPPSLPCAKLSDLFFTCEGSLLSPFYLARNILNQGYRVGSLECSVFSGMCSLIAEKYSQDPDLILLLHLNSLLLLNFISLSMNVTSCFVLNQEAVCLTLFYELNKNILLSQATI